MLGGVLLDVQLVLALESFLHLIGASSHVLFVLANDFTYTSGSGYDRLIDFCNLARIRIDAVGCLVQRLTLRLVVLVARYLFLL